jgi:hypothetical protein
VVLLGCKSHRGKVASVTAGIWIWRPIGSTWTFSVNSHSLSGLWLILSVSVHLLWKHRAVAWPLITIAPVEINASTTQSALRFKSTALRIYNCGIATSTHLFIGVLRRLLLRLLSCWAVYLVQCILLLHFRAQRIVLRVLKYFNLNLEYYLWTKLIVRIIRWLRIFVWKKYPSAWIYCASSFTTSISSCIYKI